ncbi:MAG TPA: hypothetical protein VKX16_10670 [Chloroflexota bacterium]|nr:hypothetical protein [Chloroflexota bacterium]
MKRHAIVTTLAVLLSACAARIASGTGAVLAAAQATPASHPADRSRTGIQPRSDQSRLAAPVPASDYPSHTRLEYFPTWTNQQFDYNRIPED